MDRKEFFKKLLATGTVSLLVPHWMRSKADSNTIAKPDQVGFNHLPNPQHTTMNTVYHKANTRGHANHGWLDSHHTFSFASYYDPERVHFGALRVLNDDRVAAGMGFNTHPHDNMEIISIPLEGDLQHMDSMSNVAVIKEGDIQVMSAGTGVQHSEFNKNKDREVKFLQIWVFPRERNVKPRYDQISIRELEKENEFFQVLSPTADDEGVWIHQDAWFHLGNFTANTSSEYKLKRSSNGVYIFMIKGEANVQGQELKLRDGYGIWDVDSITIDAKAGSKILLMEVPMAIR